MLSHAKLAYLLSTCSKLNDGLMRVILKQFDSKIVATRHYFKLWVTLYEPDNITNFKVKNVSFQFAGSSDIVIVEAMQYFNAQYLSNNEMTNIYKNLLSNNIKLDVVQIVSLYSIATLIKIYYAAGFKYLFIPIIIDYGRNAMIVHQTALIIDLIDEKFIYYEPYGLYTKYNKSYKNAIEELFNCFSGFHIFNNLQYTTYHNMLSLTEGIQSILIKKNNVHYNEFYIKYNNILQRLKEIFPNDNFEPYVTNDSSVDRDDKTVGILNLLSNIDNFYTNNLDDEKKKNYHNILNDALTLYYCYNSKTCVSITMIEMNKFFKLYDKYKNVNNTTDNILKEIKQYYSLYYYEKHPNKILMNDIYKLVDLFKDNTKIKNLLSNNKQSHKICKKL